MPTAESDTFCLRRSEGSHGRDRIGDNASLPTIRAEARDAVRFPLFVQLVNSAHVS
jgi:hypothetical protein